MTRADMTTSARKPVGAALVGALIILFAEAARAEDGCTLRGDPVMPKGVAISDAAGTDIAQFTGAKVAIAVSGFGSSGGRAKVETSGFRVEGFVRSREIPVYTVRSVPAYAGHVWI